MMTPISQILSDQHGISGRPGQKVECPFCSQQSFSLKKDDTLGKCFHPSCGEFISAYHSEQSPTKEIFLVLSDIYRDFHKALLKPEKKTHNIAYDYCVHERRIHPLVVANSMLGVVPNSFDPKPYFESHINELKDAIEVEKEKEKPKGRPPKNRPLTARERLEKLDKVRDKLFKCAAKNPGWLAFFYTDHLYRIVSIRFRQPYGHKMTMFKPTKVGGVFNRELHLSLNKGSRQNHFDDKLLIVEGEFNQLQLQTLMVREAERQEDPLENWYVYACAIGGVNNADAMTIKKISSQPVVCYDNDSDKAGFALVENLHKTFSLTGFTTPKVDSDLDSFILSFGRNSEKAFTELKALIVDRKLYLRPFDAVKSDVDKIRRLEGIRDGLKKFEVNRRVAEIIVSDLEERGDCFRDTRMGYLFLRDEKVLIVIEKDSLDLERLFFRYGLLVNEDIYTAVLKTIRLKTMEEGSHIEIHLFSYYNQASNTLYLFDFQEGIYRIKASGIEHVDNGADGVLFLRNRDWLPFSLGEKDDDRSVIDELLLQQIPFKADVLSIDEQRALFLIWLHSLFFPDHEGLQLQLVEFTFYD